MGRSIPISHSLLGEKIMSTVDLIIRYEQGDMTADEIIEFYQHLVDTGTIRGLQGHYQRAAQELFIQGLITVPIGKKGKTHANPRS